MCLTLSVDFTCISSLYLLSFLSRFCTRAKPAGTRKLVILSTVRRHASKIIVDWHGRATEREVNSHSSAGTSNPSQGFVWSRSAMPGGVVCFGDTRATLPRDARGQNQQRWAGLLVLATFWRTRVSLPRDWRGRTQKRELKLHIFGNILGDTSNPSKWFVWSTAGTRGTVTSLPSVRRHASKITIDWHGRAHQSALSSKMLPKRRNLPFLADTRERSVAWPRPSIGRVARSTKMSPKCATLARVFLPSTTPILWKGYALRRQGVIVRRSRARPRQSMVRVAFPTKASVAAEYLNLRISKIIKSGLKLRS